MLNLLNIIATLFTGVASHVPNGNSFAKVDLLHECNAYELDYNGVDYVGFDFELTPIVSIFSDYFEIDARLDGELFYSLNIVREFSDVYLSDINAVDLVINIYDIYITCFNDSVSTINLYFDYDFEFTVTYNNDLYYYDYFTGNYDYDYFTNFTINSTFDFIDEDFVYVFSTTFNADLGFDAGYNDGYSEGYNDGVEFGFNDGYQAGSNDLDNVFNGSWVEWLGNAVTGFFALEIFPGFSLAGALGAVLCAYIMMWILKVLAGG